MSVDPAAAASVRRHALRPWLVLALVFAAVATTLAYKIVSLHAAIDRDERERLLTQTRVIAANLDEQLNATFVALADVRDDAPAWPSHAAMNSEGARRLQLLVGLLRGVRTINVLDRNGTALFSNRAELIGKNFAGREYFIAVRDTATPERAVLSAPFRTVLGAWGMNLALVIPGHDGKFNGAVTATLSVDYFHTLLASVNYAPDMRAVIDHGDGVVFAVAPANPEVEGKNIAVPGSFYTQHRDSGRKESVYAGRVATTGDQRLVALITVQSPQLDRPLVAATSRSLDAIFASWRAQSVTEILVLLTALSLSAVALRLTRRRFAAHEIARTHLATQLHQSEFHFKAIIEASPVPFALNDAQQNITYLNAAFTRTFGYTREDIPTLSEWWPRAYPDADYRQWVATTWANHLQTAQREHQPFAPLELNIHCKNGETRTALVGATPLDESFGNTHLVVLYDITERKATDTQRERLQAQLRHAQKMEAVGQLTGGIAHDFNNILASVLGYSELLREELPHTADGKAARHLDQIQRAGERARDLVAKMLAFARGTTGEPRVLDPRAAIREIVNMLGPTLPGTVKVEVDIDAEIPTIRADLVQLHQIVANLLINARDALPGAGTIRVGLYRASAHDATCNACGEFFSGKFFTLSVSDNGSGIAPETLPHIFNPFYTTKEVNKGTGLGLSVVHGIVHELDGHILVDSTQENGTTFRVLFPVVPVQEESHG